MLGGSPDKGVWTITSTSEMSGSASRGIWRNDQIPASTRSNVPAKTRKRFRAHQSIHREITSHSSCGIDVQLLTSYDLAVFLGKDCDLPCSATFKLARSFIKPVAPVAECDRDTHCRHAHCRHGRHEKCDANVCS